MKGFNNSVEDDVLADLAEVISTRIYSRTEMKCQRCTDAKSWISHQEDDHFGNE